MEFVRSLHVATLGNIQPDLTFLLDIPPEKGLQRTQSRTHHETRFEKMDFSFHAALREGFLKLAEAEPQRFIVLNAERDAVTIHRQLVAALKERYNLPL